MEIFVESYRDKRRKLGGRASLLVDILCEDVGNSLVQCFQVS